MLQNGFTPYAPETVVTIISIHFINITHDHQQQEYRQHRHNL
jgi:hypothetical protein